MKRLENKWAEIIVISVITMCFLSSCGIQFGNYERYKQVHKNNTCGIKEITNETGLKGLDAKEELSNRLGKDFAAELLKIERTMMVKKISY